MAAAASNEEDDSYDELGIIKAHTMYRMVHHLPGGKRVLHLTNQQAKVIAENPSTLPLMFDALEIQKPSLVIEFLHSWGFGPSLRLHDQATYEKNWTDWMAGALCGRPPFIHGSDNVEDEETAERHIDMFMSEVLLPLAERTNAIILGCAVRGDCVLTDSFQRVFALHRAKWGGGKPPFTILSVLNTMEMLYGNEKDNAEWITIMKSCKSWRVRHSIIEATYKKKVDEDVAKGATRKVCNHDIDPSATCILVTDGVDPDGKYSPHPHGKMVVELMRYLNDNHQSLCIKTGTSRKEKYDHSSSRISLSTCCERVLAKLPVLLLDVRKRDGLPPIARGSAATATADGSRAEAPRDGGSTHKSPTRSPRFAAMDADEETAGWRGRSKTEGAARRSAVGELAASAAAPFINQVRVLTGSAPSAHMTLAKGCTRADRMAAAKAIVAATCRELRDQGLVETMDCCTLAFLRAALFDDGKDDVPRRHDGRQLKQPGAHTPGHRAATHPQLQKTTERLMDVLERHRVALHNGDEISLSVGAGEQGASVNDIAEVTTWVADRIFEDAYGLLPDRKKKRPPPATAKAAPEPAAAAEAAPASADKPPKDGAGEVVTPLELMDHREVYREFIAPYATFARTLLSSKYCHHANIATPEGLAKVKQKVRELTQLDRLPTTTSYPGLLLLRRAWRDYDVAVHLAGRYKFVAKLIFYVQLLLGWLVLAGTTLAGFLHSSGGCLLSAEPPVTVAQVSSIVCGALHTAGRECTPTEASAISSALQADEAFSDPALVMNEAQCTAALYATNAVFGISITSTVLIALDGWLSPQARWRHLRVGAGSLLSIIWMYRTRIGPFELDLNHRESERPESMLRSVLQEWRDTLLNGAAMKHTNFVKKYDDKIYVHLREAPTAAAVKRTTAAAASAAAAVGMPEAHPDGDDDLIGLDGLMGGGTGSGSGAMARRADLLDEGVSFKEAQATDDFHSPERPDGYIWRRIKPALRFYQQRIPFYTRHALLLRLLIILLGVVTSVLTAIDDGQQRYMPFVAMVAAAAAAATSWMEFAAAQRKIERYTSAANGLTKLLVWWDSLNEVQRQTKESIATLINTSEAVISEEQLAWMSTAKHVGGSADKGEAESGKDADGNKANGGSGWYSPEGKRATYLAGPRAVATQLAPSSPQLGAQQSGAI